MGHWILHTDDEIALAADRHRDHIRREHCFLLAIAGAAKNLTELLASRVLRDRGVNPEHLKRLQRTADEHAHLLFQGTENIGEQLYIAASFLWQGARAAIEQGQVKRETLGERILTAANRLVQIVQARKETPTE